MGRAHASLGPRINASLMSRFDMGGILRGVVKSSVYTTGSRVGSFLEGIGELLKHASHEAACHRIEGAWA